MRSAREPLLRVSSRNFAGSIVRAKPPSPGYTAVTESAGSPLSLAKLAASFSRSPVPPFSQTKTVLPVFFSMRPRSATRSASGDLIPDWNSAQAESPRSAMVNVLLKGFFMALPPEPMLQNDNPSHGDVGKPFETAAQLFSCLDVHRRFT